MSEPVIVCSHLTHYYGKRKIYEDLNFEVGEGRILGLLGKNGTGKTTTINILMGYLKPKSGECRIFGEDAQHLSVATKQRVALLLEGHVQYQFMTVEEIERFYAPFYPRWNRDVYYQLVGKLRIAPHQKIARMSNGQRSQVALGLILAQNADMMVLDDFSLGLDPGYRRLFVDYLHDYATSEHKTIFLTSHIIQDMERLIDDCIIMDYGRILCHESPRELMAHFRRFTFHADDIAQLQPLTQGDKPALYHPELLHGHGEVYSFRPREEVKTLLAARGIDTHDMQEEHLSLEDAFIGLTGKY